MSGGVTRRSLLKAGAWAGATWIGAPMLNLGRVVLSPAFGLSVSTAAVDAVAESTVIDMLSPLTLDWDELRHWQFHPGSFGETEFRYLESSAIQVFHPAVETRAEDPRERAKQWLARWQNLLGNTPCSLSRIESLADLLQARGAGKLGVLQGFQNANHFRDVEDVERFHGWGQRVSQLTYNERNRLGSGCWVENDTGLTELGAEVVASMNRLGMVVDVSHCGERTSVEAIATSRKPVLITHSNCRALLPHQRRNKSDRVIELMAAGGGVMGITVVRGFVGSGSPTLEDLLDHFDHVIRVAGVEHVGLGSDVDVEGLDPSTGRPSPIYRIRGLDLRWRVFQIAEGLLGRGYGRADVELVLGGNFLRALAAIWADAPFAAVPEDQRRRDPFCPAPAPVGREVGGTRTSSL